MYDLAIYIYFDLLGIELVSSEKLKGMTINNVHEKFLNVCNIYRGNTSVIY